jgi:hypothetical protein
MLLDTSSQLRKMAPRFVQEVDHATLLATRTRKLKRRVMFDTAGSEPVGIEVGCCFDFVDAARHASPRRHAGEARQAARRSPPGHEAESDCAPAPRWNRGAESAREAAASTGCRCTNPGRTHAAQHDGDAHRVPTNFVAHHSSHFDGALGWAAVRRRREHGGRRLSGSTVGKEFILRELGCPLHFFRFSAVSGSLLGQLLLHFGIIRR